MTGTHIVNLLLDHPGRGQDFLNEASVHLPARGTIWMAVFTGPEPGKQVWRSTGLKDRGAALVLARKWEQEARDERLLARAGQPGKSGNKLRAREVLGLLTQQQVAAVLGMSERGVRVAERRALAKLRKNPLLRELWDEYDQTGSM